MKDLDRLPNRSPDVDPLPGPYIATIKAEIHDLVQAFTDISVLLRELPQQISWISQSADEGTRRWAWPSGHFRNCAGEQPGPAILLCQIRTAEEVEQFISNMVIPPVCSCRRG